MYKAKKYGDKIIFIYTLFWGTHLQVRPVDGFSHMMAQTTRTRARMCHFWNFSHCSSFRGSKTPQNPQFWGVNRRFQAKLAKSKNVHIFKTTASIPTKFCTVIKTTKCPSWVVSTHALQIQDGERPPAWKNRKSLYLSRGLTDFDEICQDDAVRDPIDCFNR